MKETATLTISPSVERHNDEFFAMVYTDFAVDDNSRCYGMSNKGAFATARAARMVLQLELPSFVERRREEYGGEQVSIAIKPIRMFLNKI